MDGELARNLAVSAALVASMTVLTLLGGWVVVGLEAICIVLWRSYTERGVGR